MTLPRHLQQYQSAQATNYSACTAQAAPHVLHSSAKKPEIQTMTVRYGSLPEQFAWICWHPVTPNVQQQQLALISLPITTACLVAASASTAAAAAAAVAAEQQ
jgi:hypothetical protein